MQSKSSCSLRIPESVVQDIWARQLFDQADLVTTDSRKVRIVNPGRRNRDGGPDFLAAQIVIGTLRWFGDVEIHTSSGIWNEHKHQKDPRYNNVVLHVSLLRDFWSGNLSRQDGTILPEIILEDYLSASITSLMHQLARTDRESIPCESSISTVDPETIRNWIYRLARVRVEKRISAHAHSSAHVRHRQFFRMIFRALGYSKNADSMERLFDLAFPFIDTVPIEDLPALLLGIAGLLPNPANLDGKRQESTAFEYRMLNTFAALTQHIPLPKMSSVEWNFFRLRPASFPDLRILQAATILSLNRLAPEKLSYPSLRSVMMSEKPLQSLRQLFLKPDCVSAAMPKPSFLPGKGRVDRLIINAVAPFILVESVLARDEHTSNAMLSVLSRLPAEKDSVTRMFETLGIRNTDAYFSQGLHELRREYCSNLKCLTCDIGTHILHSSGQDVNQP